ncbi:50S ribosomal protein L10 [Candidatus Woesearchaeota archaeon]|nr:50S ribosomal protein L10 [Candidatus Woesearchaeota archaeon]
MAHISKQKQDTVAQFAQLLKEYPIVGAVNMENMPASQLQTMRAQLRGTVVLLMTKRRLLKIAIGKAKQDRPGIEQILPYLKGMPALLFTKENPFVIYKTIQKSKSSAPAKAGQIAPNDIKVSAGPTPFAPGPIIGELGACKIKAGIEAGKVTIKEDTIVAQEGDVITDKLASILSRLGIQPMEIGLNVEAIYENGAIYTKSVLGVDEKEYIANIQTAAQWAFNLAIEAGVLTKETTEFMLAKAFMDSKALAISQDILTDRTVGDILAKAERQMQSLKAEAKIE